MSFNIKRINENAIVPLYQSKGASCFDFHSCENIVILPGQVVAVNTGLGFDIPEEYEIQVRSRSGLALKRNVFVLNSPGTVDSDYKGEVKVILCNASNQNFSIAIGDRIAQGAVCKVERPFWNVVTELQESERGSEGFGSTGT